MRGYRKESVAAPLKENLAAALLLKCDWPKIAEHGAATLLRIPSAALVRSSSKPP